LRAWKASALFLRLSTQERAVPVSAIVQEAAFDMLRHTLASVDHAKLSACNPHKISSPENFRRESLEEIEANASRGS
jgi:hypothetical protein